MTAWLYLALAAVFEVIFAMSMKASHGFTRLVPSVVTVVGIVGGLGFLSLAMRTLPVSVAYPAWTAVGILGTVILGWALFDEALTPLKIGSALLIVVGVAGLRASG